MLATSLAFAIAVGEGQFAACNPLVDGCVSISRAARHGLPNHLFRALMLPAAVFQGLVWLLCVAWLRSSGALATRWLRVLPLLGIGAAAFLILYGAFLGTEGVWYQWMRRFGIVFYFGLTTISMLIVAGAVRATPLRSAAIILIALCATLPLLGLANTLAPLVLNDAAAIDGFENATEWWGGLVFTLFFGALAQLWRRSRFAAQFHSLSDPGSD